MKFGLFGSAQAKRGGSDIDSAQGFRDFIDYNVEAEALGYSSTFVVEHHFTGFGQVSASLNLLTFLAARTSTLRLGTAVLVLPWHNPVLLAEAAATIDLLSGGRLEFGVGKGYRHNEFAGFCIPIAEADARFEESLGLILKAWTSNERFSHHGTFWNFENVIVEPPTRQKPHPPVWMAAGQPDSIRKVAQRGAKLLLDQFASVPQTIERFNIYKAEVEAQGRRFDPMDVGVARAFYVATDAEDKRKAVEARLANQRRMTELAAAPGAVQIEHAVVRLHARCGGRERAVRRTRRDRREARAAARGWHRASAAQRRWRAGHKPAPLCPRGHAGVFGRGARGRGIARQPAVAFKSPAILAARASASAAICRSAPVMGVAKPTKWIEGSPFGSMPSSKSAG